MIRVLLMEENVAPLRAHKLLQLPGFAGRSLVQGFILYQECLAKNSIV